MPKYKMTPEECLAYIATECNQDEFTLIYKVMRMEDAGRDTPDFIEHVWHEIGKLYAEEGRDRIKGIDNPGM